MARICAAFLGLRQLASTKPSGPLTLFKLLYLEPHAAPFNQPKDAVRPGTNRHDSLTRKIMLAGELLRAALRSSGEGYDEDKDMAEKTIRADWFVADMLLREDIRTAFLENVQLRPTTWI